jgi:hypothetical protein
LKATSAKPESDPAREWTGAERSGLPYPLTRPFSGSTTELPTNFAGETAAVIGIAYLFHKTGHLELEGITSMVNAETKIERIAREVPTHHVIEEFSLVPRRLALRSPG